MILAAASPVGTDGAVVSGGAKVVAEVEVDLAETFTLLSMAATV